METGTSAATTFTLPSESEVRLTRVFDAPRKLVFEAFTDPKHITQWMYAMGGKLIVCEMDLKVGGTFRYVWRNPDGTDLRLKGEILEVSPYDRLVHTEIFEDFSPDGSVVTSTFVENNGKTTFTSTVKFISEEVRDMVLSTGMEEGWGETIERLAGYLPTIKG